MPFYEVTFDEWNVIADGEVPTVNGYCWILRKQTGRRALVMVTIGQGGEWSLPENSPLPKEKVTHWFGPFPQPPDIPDTEA